MHIVSRVARMVATVAPDPSRSGAILRRAGALTPYEAQTLADDALHAGRGARLEITLAPGAADADVTAVRDSFAWLGTRGVAVRVRRAGRRRLSRRAA